VPALASTGTSSLLTLGVIAIGATLLAVMFGQLTKRVPNSDGGLYAYARHEFGDFAGYLTGWCYWIQCWAGNAAIVAAWVFYVDALFGIHPSGIGNWCIALTGLWVPAIVNLAGVRQMAWFQNLTVVLKFLLYVAVTAVIMGLVPHHALVGDTAPFVTAFGTIFTHGAWAGKLVAALAVVSGIGALNGWTLVTTEVSRAAAQDGLFPRAFAWTDRKGTAWFGIVMAALLPSALMLWSYTTATGLTVFTNLVALTVVTVAIPYLFSACAQLSYLVSRRRRVQGWALARDAAIAGAGVLFSLWVTFAAGYQAVYLALLVVLAGVVVYAFLKAYRERTGQIAAPAENPPLEPASGTIK